MNECWHDNIRSRLLPTGKVRITCQDCGATLDEYSPESLGLTPEAKP